MICLTPKPSQSFFVYRIQSREFIFFSRKIAFKEKTERKIEQKNDEKAF